MRHLVLLAVPTFQERKDFEAGTFHNQTIGIPYLVVAGTPGESNGTYTLYSTNQFGRMTATVALTVH